MNGSHWPDMPHPGDAIGYEHHGPTPPHSLEAERECVASPLVDAGSLVTLARLLRVEDFYSERHQALFAAMLELRERGTPVDGVTLAQRLRDRGSYERVGGARAISELLDRAGTAGNVVHYAEIVRRKAAARALIDAARSIEAAGHSGADDELESYMAESAQALRHATDRFRPTGGLQLRDWTAQRYQGQAPAVDWLVPDVLARGEAHVLAAPGDSGKGFITLNLALQLASGVYFTGRRAPFGRAILPLAKPVTCVLLYAEDAEDALHRRIEALDADGLLRERAGDRFIAVAMPSTGGAPSILEREPGGTFRTTERWRDIVDQLAHVPDLGCVLLDPLSNFLALDIDADSAVAQAVMGETARCAATLNAAFIAAHHMRKNSAETMGRVPELPTHESVRDSIRGVAALLNGVRMAYGIVPLPSRYAKAVLNKLGERGELDVGRVYWGAIVKANGKTDRRPRLYVRSDYGLLEDRTSDIAVSGRLDDALKALIASRGDS
jgi:hypothetical protein